MKDFTIVIPSFNNIKWYTRNLDSVLNQAYHKYNIIYTDDCSTDGTADAVENYVNKKQQWKDKFTLIRNKERKGAMENLYDMIHSIPDDNIILTVDGDDWLAHRNVLNKLNEIYSQPNIWITWGQYKDSQGGIGCSREIPKHIIASNSYRKFRWCTSHLRTFYAWMFKKIPKEEFLNNDGKFYAMAWDLIFMQALVEFSHGKGKFIPDILYIYNTENPIQDCKVNIKLQQATERIIRARKPFLPLKDKNDIARRP